MRYCEVCRASFQASGVCPRDRVRVRADIEDPLQGSVVGGRYRVLERIAAGGMGQIYRAAHTRIASLVAVKVLYGELTHVPEMRARFQREAEAASCLSSRHIVRVLDFGETEEGLLYIAMEHLSGASLSSVIGRDGPLAPERAVRIAQQVVRGLAHAHERGIVHRDLKPDNVMLVAEDDEDDVVKILDFGIAQIRSASKLTSAGQTLGTPLYMAPEQFVAGEIDARADLYALGAMTFESLTGAPPFEAATMVDLARAHALEAPPSVRTRRADVDPALDAIVTRLLAKAPDDRFPSARAVGDALRALRPGAAPAPASARAAGRAVPADVADRVRAAIQVGAPLYNAGDHAGCARVYQETAEALLARATPNEPRVAVTARLRAALARAGERSSPTHAAWELRWAFDDLVSASDVAIDPSDDALRAEIASAQAIAASRYAANDLEAVGDYYLSTARALVEWLRAEGRDAPLAAWLKDSADQAVRSGDGRRVLAQLGEALESVRASRSSALPSGPPPAARSSPRVDAPWVDGVAQRIASAIAVGAPAYNRGDVAGCLRLYRQTAEAIVSDLASDATASGAVGRLRAALERSTGETVDQGAWTMRRAFDELLAGRG
jgi:hypothetical protein